MCEIFTTNNPSGDMIRYIIKLYDRNIDVWISALYAQTTPDKLSDHVVIFNSGSFKVVPIDLKKAKHVHLFNCIVPSFPQSVEEIKLYCYNTNFKFPLLPDRLKYLSFEKESEPGQPMLEIKGIPPTIEGITVKHSGIRLMFGAKVYGKLTSLMVTNNEGIDGSKFPNL